jgi:hypothetical protein
MILSETEFHTQREVILQYFNGHTCVYEDVVHFDSIQVYRFVAVGEKEVTINLCYCLV